MEKTITAETVNLSELGNAALEYGRRGWRVFPCVPLAKAPLTEHGFKDASNDAATISAWWTRFPQANIGLALDETIIVIDVDPRNGGIAPEIVLQNPTLTCNTGGGGQHYYYRKDNSTQGVLSKPNLRGHLTAGVDIKTLGGYVLLPPSCTAQHYEWAQSDASVSPLPEELEKLIVKPPVELRPDKNDVPYDQRPGTLYNQTTPWHTLLIPDGWTKVGEGLNEDGSKEEFWCRPGKSSGISATTNYGGSGLLYVFSSSTTLIHEGSYSKFEYLTETRYNGDYSMAARDIMLFRDTGELPTGITNGTLRMKEEYSFVPAFAEGHFVYDFIDYVQRQTDAPHEYAEAAAFSVLSIAGYRCKAALAPYPGGLSNNLYVLLVGPTTVSRKSTVQRIATQIVKAVMPPAILPNRSTTEALIKSLSNRSGVPSLWTPDEFGVTLSQIYTRDFMAGLEEMLLTVYSGDDYVYERVLDTVTIRSPHLSVLAAATPESLARAGATALDSGLLPRFAIVYPKLMPERRGVSQAPKLFATRQNLISRLNDILSWSNTVRDITFSTEALEILNHAEQELTAGAAARLPTMLYKVAALSAISEKRSNVHAADADSASKVVSRWAAGVAALVPEMYKHGTDQQFELQLQYVLDELHKAGGSLFRVDIANTLNVTKRRLDEIEATLHDKGKISVDNEGGGRRWVLQ